MEEVSGIYKIIYRFEVLSVRKISDSIITKQGINTESFYDYLISKYIAPYFTIFFKSVGIKSPNLLTFLSFLLIVASSILVLNTDLLNNFYYRFSIALLIQLSFILDCSDGQLARITGKTTKIGAWLDRILDRAGEFLIFTATGFSAFYLYGKSYFIFLGILTGYMLSAFTLAMSLGDSLILENYKRVKSYISIEDYSSEVSKNDGLSLKDILSKVFFFLNFGIGERYLYLSFFVLINNIGLMLYITSFLSLTRTIGIYVHVRKKLKVIDSKLRSGNGKG